MKVTEEMEATYVAAAYQPHEQVTASVNAGLEAVLRDVPDVVPFTFPGCPDLEAYLHKCGTVVDVPSGESPARTQIEAGECDCESTSPWHRIYVEKRS